MISPNEDLLSFTLTRETLQRSVELPRNFPYVEEPRFCDGQKLRWITQGEKSDWGVAIGRFYNYAPHRRRWMWCYLIWLDKKKTRLVLLGYLQIRLGKKIWKYYK